MNNKKVSDVAGCLIDQEREFLLQYAQNTYRGMGHIVDLGCFLGSSTYPLAVGMDNNQTVTRKSGRIYAYDRFEWNAWMDRPASRYQLGRSYTENECFVDEFKRQMGDKLEFINIVKGDLTKLKWESSAPIEYLFVDAMKNWQLCNSIIGGFYPAMRPGLSYLHHQDYVFFQTYWIHLTMFRMRDYFEPVEHPYLGPSKIFRYTTELPVELINQAYAVEDFSESEINDAFDYASGVVHPAGHANISGARVAALLARGLFDSARAAFESAKLRHPGAFDGPILSQLEPMLQQPSRAAG